MPMIDPDSRAPCSTLNSDFRANFSVSLTEGLHVVSPGLFDAEAGVDGGVPGRAREVLVFSVRDVLVGARVPVLLRQAEVDDVDQVALLAQTPGNKDVKIQ